MKKGKQTNRENPIMDCVLQGKKVFWYDGSVCDFSPHPTPTTKPELSDRLS
jgi:hypothetical protein